jgi:TldD protein
MEEILSAALSRGGDFADVFIENKRVTGIGLEDGKIERMQSGSDIGAGIRVISGESTAYAHTNDLSREGLLRSAEVVARALGNGSQERTFDLRTLRPTVEFPVSEPPDAVTAEHKVDMLQQADRAARAVDRDTIKQVMVGYGDVVQEVTIGNSEGVYVEDRRVRTRFLVNAVAAKGDVIQTGYEAAGTVTGFELFKVYDPTQMAANAAQRAKSLLDAEPAPSGKMPVVLAGEAGGTMVHEACGHGLEADLVQKGLSVYSGKPGEPVADASVTVIDDSTLPDRYGSYAFDDEGVPSRPVTLIKDGVLTEFLYDRLTARKEERDSNGHGRRESYQHKPVPRMANTYIAPGKANPEEMIRDVREGVLVRKMGGGQVNTTTGDFVFEVAEGYLIQDGDVGPMIRGATLTGNGPEVLRRVSGVGSDLGFTIGTCGKEGQGVPVSDAQPTLLFAGDKEEDLPISVGGTRMRGKTNAEVTKSPRIRRV